MRLDLLFVARFRRCKTAEPDATSSSGSVLPVCSMHSFFPGDHGARAIPVPIPNTEVKTRRGDGTASLGGGRVARCQDFFSHRTGSLVRFFCSLRPFPLLEIRWPAPSRWSPHPPAALSYIQAFLLFIFGAKQLEHPLFSGERNPHTGTAPFLARSRISQISSPVPPSSSSA